MKKTSPGRVGNEGFSLVEISLAVGIAAVALITLVGFLSGAMKDKADSADQTAIGLILEDVHDRIEGAPLESGMIADSPFFYDQRGIPVQPEAERSGEEKKGSILTEAFFRADVELVKPESEEEIFADDVFAVKVDLYWPLVKEGMPKFPGSPGASVTYLTTTRSGIGWKAVDPGYVPKIEY